MALAPNGVLTLATLNFNEIDAGYYTFASADPNFPNELLVASSVNSAGRRDIKCERRVTFAPSGTDPAALLRVYTVIQIPRHVSSTDANITGTLAQLAGLYTSPMIAAMRRGER